MQFALYKYEIYFVSLQVKVNHITITQI